MSCCVSKELETQHFYCCLSPELSACDEDAEEEDREEDREDDTGDEGVEYNVEAEEGDGTEAAGDSCTSLMADDRSADRGQGLRMGS